MSNKLITANPNDKSATVVCKTISLEPSFFMGRSLLWYDIQSRKIRPGGGSTMPPGLN
jgi:hypothetical protein